MIGIVAAIVVFFAIDTYRDIQTASRFAQLQQESPSDWLELDGFGAQSTRYPGEPSLAFVGTPSHDLLIRVAVSSRNADTGNVLCSGGGRAALFQAGVAVAVDAPVSRLAGLDACDWPVGRYKVRLTFLMTEPQSQVNKTLLVETDDVEVIAAGGSPPED